MRSLILHNYGILLSIVFVSLLAGLPALGQLPEIKNGHSNFSQYNLQEKIYVHTDRSYYLCGEVLWFKAYLTNAENHLPLSISKVGYIELLNKMHQPVLQGKISMKNGTGNGSFYLPFSVASGNYILRAYTNWMKNFSEDYFFEKNISIVNSSASLDSSAVPEPGNYAIDFFPEGGNLVNGLKSKIAFKVNDSKSKEVECKGVIVDQLNDTVASFKSLQFGMGYFSLKPENEKRYTAIVNFKDGFSIRKKLPEAYDNGYVLHVADTGFNDLKISVTVNGKNISRNSYVIIQSNGRIDFAKSLFLENNEAIWVINKDSLKDGVSRITVFDSNKRPLCERLYFKRPNNKMLINAKADKENYQLRSKVLVNVSTSDQEGISLSGNLSASVYRLDNLHQPDPENIFSYLWLSSELRRSIEDPGYYFRNENGETNEALDNLMLTQGWRRFNWDNVIQNKKPAFTYAPEYAGHIITGRITNENTKLPVPDVQVYLSVPGKRVQLRGCISDSAGLIHFEMKDFFGANQIVIQTNDGIDSIYRLQIFSPFSEKFSDKSFPGFYFDEKYRSDLLTGNIHMEVQNVYHESRLQQLVKPAVDTVPFYFKPTKTYLLGDYTRFTTMEEVMREYVAEVIVRRNGTKFRFFILNNPAIALKTRQTAELVFENNPLVLLDGVPVFDIHKIITYDPLKVQKLEVVAERYHFGSITADGILNYTTYEGNLGDFSLNPGALVLDYEGLQEERVFYSPQYSNENERSSRLPDFRDLLFWTPELNTNINGNGEFSFYTGDIPGHYMVVVQGLSSNGEAGSGSFIFDVRK